jgi:zinc transport system permease protein
MELLNYSFFVNALLSAVFISVICGMVGTYIVSKRIVFISGGITHTSFGGIGLGYFLGINPLLGAAVFSVLSAMGIEFLSRKIEVRQDSAIAIMWSFGMAVGIMFIFLSPGYAPNLMSYLFGSILTVSNLELFLIIVLSMLVTIFFILFYKAILYITFDEEFASTKQLPVNFFNYFMLVVVALTIVASIKIAGVILVISLLTIPQAISNIYFKEFKKIIFSSIITGIIATIGGLLLSFYIDVPSGATIILFLVILFFAAKGFSYLT